MCILYGRTPYGDRRVGRSSRVRHRCEGPVLQSPNGDDFFETPTPTFKHKEISFLSG